MIIELVQVSLHHSPLVVAHATNANTCTTQTSALNDLAPRLDHKAAVIIVKAES
jgi:hypothetical protein